MNAPERAGTPGAPTLPDGGRPRFARGVRMRFDRSRERHVLLLPETVVVLNPTGTAVLELVDGERTVAEIVETLGARYHDGARDAIADDVRAYLAALRARRHLEIT